MAALRLGLVGGEAEAGEGDALVWGAATVFVMEMLRCCVAHLPSLPACAPAAPRVLVPLQLHACVAASPQADFLLAARQGDAEA